MNDQTLWDTDPARAAKMAFMEVMCEWHAQAERGEYDGVPAFDLYPQNLEKTTPRRTILRDTGAGVHAVPDAVRRIWAEAQASEERLPEIISA